MRVNSKDNEQNKYYHDEIHFLESLASYFKFIRKQSPEFRKKNWDYEVVHITFKETFKYKDDEPVPEKNFAEMSNKGLQYLIDLKRKVHWLRKWGLFLFSIIEFFIILVVIALFFTFL